MPTLPSSTPPEGALPSPPVRVPERIDPDHKVRPLPTYEIRERLAARERDIQYHLEAIKHEVTTVADVTVGGRPLPDVLRAHALRNALVAGGVGLALGLLRGLRKRAKRRPEPDTDLDLARLRLSIALEDAAHRVSRGADADESIRRSLKTVPVMYNEPESYAPRRPATAHNVFDLVVTSIAGFAVKVALDQLTKRLTGHEETFAAVADASDGEMDEEPIPSS